MIRNKALWERVLVVFSVFMFCMSMLGSLPESLRYGYELEAAADNITRRLTVEQTLALYGRTLNGTYYKKSNSNIYNLQFDFLGTTSQWRPDDSIYNTMITGLAYQYGNYDDVLSSLRSTPFLVYGAGIDPAVNWGAYPWEPSINDYHANVGLNFSVNIPNLSKWNQYFMWGINLENYSHYNLSYIDTIYSDYESTRRYPVAKMSSQDLLAYAIMPLYKMSSQSDIPDENRLIYNAWIHPRFSLDSGYRSITGQQLTLQSVKDYDVDSSSGLPTVLNTGRFVFLFISCPEFAGTNSFPETTTATSGITAGTTASYQTYPTVDLSGLESGVGTMVQMQDEQNYYERIQIDQLNMIIAQLNAIYQAMVERGEVPVSLTDADSYPTLNNTVLSGVNDAITTYTMAQLPADQIGNGATGLTSFMFFLNSGPWMAIGLFFIGFAIFSWFIFRGRGI